MLTQTEKLACATLVHILLCQIEAIVTVMQHTQP